MRTLVDIPDEQIEALAAICFKENTSRAELIRRAIGDYLAKKSQDEIDVFGLWKIHNHSVDGMEYQDSVRDEW